MKDGRGIKWGRDVGTSAAKGLKVKLQNYFVGAACNVKRSLRREAWNLQHAAARLSAQAGTLANH
jgi:hypothetical protein